MPLYRYRKATMNTLEDLQTYITLDSKAINSNIAYYKNHLGNNKKLAAVIKGNGYGHGLIQMGIICQNNPLIEWLCVANSSEAIELRTHKITKPILVLGYPNTDLLPLIDTPTAFMVESIEFAHFLNNKGQIYHYQFPIHIKIDTGLSRLGIMPAMIKTFIQQISALPFIRIDGIFSHFIASDTNPTLTQQQLDLFTAVIESCPTLSFENIHMSNTRAITGLTYPPFVNFFRIGLGMYGCGEPTELLHPALTWKTHIVSLKTIPADRYVSYACEYKTARLTKRALIPIGYADGYQLRLSHNAQVIVNNSIAPVIGRVGMNMSIIDVTDCVANVGDPVILMGTQAPIRPADLAHNAMIPNIRELLTGIAPHIPRKIIR